MIGLIKDLHIRNLEYVFNLDVDKLHLSEYGKCIVIFNQINDKGKIELYDKKGNLCNKEDKKYANDYNILDLKLYSIYLNSYMLNNSSESMLSVFLNLFNKQ